MKRHGWTTGLQLAGLVIALIALSLGPRPQPVAAGGAYSYDFEETVKPWEAGVNSALTLSHADNVCPLALGTGMASVTRTDVGGGYMRASFPANPGDSVVVDWSTKFEGGSGWFPVVYVGPASNPTTWVYSPGFLPGPNGWSTYHYTTHVATDSTGGAQIYIALGARPFWCWVQCHPPVAVGIDCVRVSILSTTR